ncbi:MAG: YceI family protein [Ilumatobacteraceae bacterium]
MSRASATALSLIALAAGGAGGYLVGSRHGDTTTIASAPVKLSTAKVQQLDLVTFDETTATLGFTNAPAAGARTAASGSTTGATASASSATRITQTITSIIGVNTSVQQGEVLYTVDGAPVVALDGALPAWRSLSTSSDDGPDVAQLEAGLVALWYDPEPKVTVDNHFDSVTRTMVKAWQEGLGVETTGTVALGSVAHTRRSDSRSARSRRVVVSTRRCSQGAGSTPSADGVAGNWAVDTSVGEFSFENSTGTFVGFRVSEELSGIGSTTAVGRTPAVSGTMTIDGTKFDLGGYRGRYDSAKTSVTASGDLTVHGVTKSVEIPLEAQLTGNTIVVVGSLDVVFSDFGISAPTAPVVLSVDDHGQMELQLFFSRV